MLTGGAGEETGMTVALVLDFAGGTKEQYDEVVRRMGLGDRSAPGGLFHAAGRYGDAWRVVDVWEDPEQFRAFADAEIKPHTRAVGMAEPSLRMLEVDETKVAKDDAPAFLQVVTLPGLDRESFHAADEKVLPSGPPSEMTFHVNGPVEGGWMVIDAWTSKDARDHFAESN